MPQLDPAYFVTQIFWLVVTFVILYLIMWRIVLPKIGDLLQERQERIDDDLQRAESLRNDAAEALASYEKAVAEGREKAQAMLREAAEKSAAEADIRGDVVTARLKQEGDAAEQRIDAARIEAIGNIQAIAAEVAQAATARLIDGEVSDSEALSAVTDAVRERDCCSRHRNSGSESGSSF